MAADSGFRLMGYDVPSSTPWNPGENVFFVAVEGDTPEEVAAYWQQLSEDAAIAQPLLPSQWSPLYGMLKDRFGVPWVLSVISRHNGG